MTRHARNGTVRLAYEVSGDGPDLVLVHGLGYARWGWEPVVRPLSERFRVVLLDNRGIGASDVPPGPYTVSDMAADVVAVLDAAGAPRAHVVGTSLGGMIAMELALGWPDRVDHLVLAATTPGGPDAYPIPEATARLLAEAASLPQEVALRAFVENALAPATVAGRPELVEAILARRLAEPPDPDGWAAQAAAALSWQAGERLADLKAPTLVLHGEDDRVIDVRNRDLLAERIPDSSTAVFPGAGHLLLWEQPDRFVATVVGFLAGREER